ASSTVLVIVPARFTAALGDQLVGHALVAARVVANDFPRRPEAGAASEDPHFIPFEADEQRLSGRGSPRPKDRLRKVDSSPFVENGPDGRRFGGPLCVPDGIFAWRDA